MAQVVCDAMRLRQVQITAERERELFADGPFAALTWDNHPTQPRIKHRSDNMASVVGTDVAMALQANVAQRTFFQDKSLAIACEGFFEPLL